MSHFKVIVIWENVEEQLEPFSEDLRVEKYSTGIVSDEEKGRFMDFYLKENPKESKLSFDELYKIHWEDWNDNGRWYNDEWKLNEYSKYNPNAKWDWYQVWWRYASSLPIKEWAEYEEPNFSWWWDQEEKDKALKERLTNTALIKDIDLDRLISEKKEMFIDRYNTILSLDTLEDWERTKILMTRFWWDIEELKDVKENKITLEQYLEKYNSYPISSYAILKDWEWFGRWNMWWFLMPSYDKDDYEWDQFIKTTIESCDENTRLTVVDCHI